MDFKNFLKSKREELGYSQNKLAKTIKMTQSYYNALENGEIKNPPSEKILNKMIEILKLSDKEITKFNYLVAVERTPAPVLEKLKKLTMQKNKKLPERKYIQFYSKINMKTETSTKENNLNFISLPEIKNTKTLFTIDMEGDSMEPLIKNSSLIICRKYMEVKNNEIGVFMVNGKYYIKRLKISKNYTALTSDNHDYSPIFINPKDKFAIVGKVLKVINDIQ